MCIRDSLQWVSGSAGFVVYLIGAFISGLCMCMLNTVVNPMLNLLGGGGNRGNQLVQIGGVFNSAAAVCVYILMGALIGDASKAKVSAATPALMIALAIFIFALVVIFFTKIQEPQQPKHEATHDQYSCYSFRHFKLGMLAIAVYVNYAMSDGKLETAQVQSKDSVTYGDTAFVNAEANQAAEESQPAEESEPADETSGAYSVNGDAEETAADVEAEYTAAGSAENYFAQARLERTSSRDESVAALQSMLGGGDRTEDELVTDAIAAVETSKLIESESTIESLIQAQGYSNCIVYLDGDSAKVVVQTEGLDAAQAAAIKDVILGEVSVPAENIRIFEVK